MSSILDDPQVRAAVFPLSVEFYHAAGELGLLGENVELLEGTLVQKMSKSPLHTWLVQTLFERLTRVVPPIHSLRLEQPLTLAKSEPEPDLAVVVGTPNEFRKAHPATAELVIEVAVSTLEVDRQKSGIYARANVSEYWLVDPVAQCIEVRRRPEEGQYTESNDVRAPGTLVSTAVHGFAVDLAELFQE